MQQENNTTIISEQDIINTYPKRNQNISLTYLKYKEVKQQNPQLGYKKLSKLLNKPIHTTRYWHHSNAMPEPIKTANWLKERFLIPLPQDHPKLKIIAKIAGATFSDGGIFQNLNGIFLSSSELEAVKEFGEDLKVLFGSEIEANSRIIEGGEYGHSWCYQNTNRNVIRFFQALGSPIGRKSGMELIIPSWVFLSEEIADHFFGSIMGGDGSIPKYVSGNPNPITVGITGRDHLKQNRIDFLEQIRKYFIMKGIETNKLYISKWEDTNILNLPTKSTLSTFKYFYDNVVINYCKYKKEKLEKTIRDWQRRKSMNEELKYIRL